MKLLCCVVLILFAVASAKRLRKFEGDFEFAEEDDTKANPHSNNGEKKKWIHDPDSDLCQPLHCKKREICLLEDALTAVCVSKKELHRNGDIIIPKSKILAEESKNKLKQKKGSDDDDDIFYNSDNDESDQSDDEDNRDIAAPRCAPCPVITPAFICGTDNKTYSSLCRLDYHNCIHQSTVAIVCQGFCPCKSNDHSWKKQKRNERVGGLKSKYSKTKELDNNIKKVPSDQLFADKYTFVPQDFKYENKHYKYMKYTKHDNNINKIDFGSTKTPFSEDKQRMRGFNDVLDKPSHNSLNHYKECSPSALQTMGNRLLDWFSVISANYKSRRTRNKGTTKAYFPSSCKPEVRWMFLHLDTDADSVLSLQELYDLDHDENEHCIKPFLNECDLDRDIFINSKEWCRCFDKTERPCAAVRRRMPSQLLASYMPSCDEDGYYAPTQCHTATGICWCANKHGIELANSRVRGKPDCNSLLGLNASKNKVSDSSTNNSSAEDDDDDDDDDTDQSLEGSADQPLDF